jgi:hypothetical protein
MLDRWWPALFLIGLGMLVLAWPFYSDLYTRLTAPWRWMTLGGVGALVIAVSLLMLILRRSAYVQPLADHLQVVTPFLRMSISYRRIQRTTAAAMGALFAPRSLPGLKRDILEPVGPDGGGHRPDRPSIPAYAQAFLSPFFFRTRHRTRHLGEGLDALQHRA